MDNSAPPVYKELKNIKKEEDNEEKNKISISIDSEKLELLEQKNLVELIQFIEYTCDLTLNDKRYENKSYNIFKIIKSKDKKGYEIIIDDKTEKDEQNKILNKKEDINDKNKIYEIDSDEEEEKEDLEDSMEKFNNNKEKDKQNCIKYDYDQKNVVINNKNQINKIYYNINSNKENEKYFNDSSESEEEDQKEEKEMKLYTNKKRKSFIKCTDCDLIFETIEEMTKHYYLIHDKSKKEKIEVNNKKKGINQKFEKWAEKRVQIQNDNAKQNINNIDEETEEIKKKYLEDIENIFKNKGLKIKEKMKEITLQKGIMLQNLKNEDLIDKELEEKKIIEINKTIKEMREKERQNINKETKELLKQLKSDKKRKMKEKKLNKKQEDNKEIKEENKNQKIYNIKGLENKKNKQEKINHIHDCKKQIEENKIFNNKIPDNINNNISYNDDIINQNFMKFYNEKSYLVHNVEANKLISSQDQNPFLSKKEDTNIFCEVCNRRFKGKNALIDHVKGKKHFQCNTCGKIFLSKIAIDRHCKTKAHFFEIKFK